MTNYLPVSCTTSALIVVQQTFLAELQRQTQQQYLTARSITALNLGLINNTATSQVRVGGAAW